ncbi:Tudor-knot domain-containing protein [Domibacillus tundrae]
MNRNVADWATILITKYKKTDQKPVSFFIHYDIYNKRRM